MILKYIDQETGEQIDNGTLEINLKNIESYARKNCRRCHGRGFEKMDNGSTWVHSLDSEGRIEYTLFKINERTLTCSCVDNHFSRLKSLQDKK